MGRLHAIYSGHCGQAVPALKVMNDKGFYVGGCREVGRGARVRQEAGWGGGGTYSLKGLL